jgi:hypothetical protein
LEVKRAKKRFHSLHTSILGEITSMLRKAKFMPLVELSGHNPSFIEMVEELENFRAGAEQLAKIFDIDSAESFAMINKCIELARNLAIAIDDECHDSLGAAVAALDDMPYV